MTLRAAILVAVSSPSQAAADKASLDKQLADCRAEVQRRADAPQPWTLRGEYTIPGRSRNIRYLSEAEEAIPELRELLTAVRGGVYDLVVVWDYDRMARTRALSVQVLECLKEHGVQVYSLGQPKEPVEPSRYDPLDDDTGVIVESISGLKSQLDNSKRRRQSMAGKEAKARRGEHQSVAPFGYELHAEASTVGGKIRITKQRRILEVEAATVRYIWRLAYDHDLSQRSIGAVLNGQMADPSGRTHVWATRSGAPWSTATVHSLLRNPIYAGLLRWRDVHRRKHQQYRNPPEKVLWAESDVPPLVDRQEWLAYQERLDKRRRMGGRAAGSIRNPLAGIAKCGYCGGAMYLKRAGSNRSPQLICGRFSQTRTCQKNPVSLRRLMSVVNQLLLAAQDGTQGETTDLSGTDNLRLRLKTTERELARIPERLDARYADREAGILSTDDYLRQRDRLRAEETRLTGEAASLRRELADWQTQQAERARRLAQRPALSEAIESHDMPRLRGVYRELLERIEVRGKAVSVRLRD